MEIRRAVEADRFELASFAAPLQRRSDRHVAYLANDADTIAAEMIDEDEDWTAVSAVAEHDGGLAGWLMGSVDAEMGRVWWFGPFVAGADWPTTADALYRAATARLPTAVTEEEMAVDVEYRVLIDWATGLGFAVEEGSFALTLGHPLDPPMMSIRPVDAGDVDAVSRLHDDLFPGTHTTSERLIGSADERHLRLVAELAGEVVGYVAVERQPDGEGYIDYVGVDPSHRRHGIGTELIRAGVAALWAIGCESVHLTVRERSDAARALYAGLGFIEERLIIPLRKGFSLT